MASTPIVLFSAVLLSAACMQAPAQTAAGPAHEVQTSYMHQKDVIVKAAEAMPDVDYQFKGTPEIRTFARVVNHVTEAQQHTCSVLNGVEFDPKTVPSDTADKVKIVDGLKQSFMACDKAYGALTDENLGQMVTAGKNQRSRIGLAWGNVSHDNEQYAILSMYLRLKHLAPPTSEK